MIYNIFYEFGFCIDLYGIMAFCIRRFQLRLQLRHRCNATGVQRPLSGPGALFSCSSFYRRQPSSHISRTRLDQAGRWRGFIAPCCCESSTASWRGRRRCRRRWAPAERRWRTAPAQRSWWDTSPAAPHSRWWSWTDLWSEGCRQKELKQNLAMMSWSETARKSFYRFFLRHIHFLVWKTVALNAIGTAILA